MNIGFLMYRFGRRMALKYIRYSEEGKTTIQTDQKRYKEDSARGLFPPPTPRAEFYEWAPYQRLRATSTHSKRLAGACPIGPGQSEGPEPSSVALRPRFRHVRDFSDRFKAK